MTIRKRVVKGGYSWEYCITVCKSPRKQVRKSGFKTKGEAVQAEKDFIIKYEMGLVNADKEKFSYITSKFMEHAEKAFAKSTFENYKSLLENHLFDFAHMKIKDISEIFITGWIDDKLQTDSPYITKNCIKLCKAICNFARKKRIISKNPFEDTPPIGLPKKIHGRLEKEDVAKLFEVCKNRYPNILLIIACGIFLGLRRGEILGLKWSDIDFKTKVVSIQRQYTRYGLKDKLKTRSSRRDLKFSDTLIEVIKWHKQKQKIMSEFVFTNKNGGMFSLKTLNRQFKELLKECHLKPIRFHDLRGTYVDIALSAGISPKIIQKNVGHSKITTTMDIYSEILNSLEDNAAILFEKNLNSVNIL